MRHRHGPRRPPRRPRLCPAREIQTETASGGRITGAQQRASRPAPTATRQPASHHRGARHLRDLAAAAPPTPSEIGPPSPPGEAPPGPRGLIVDLEPLPVTSCDHRHYRRPRPQPSPSPPGGNTRRGMRLSALPPRRGPLSTSSTPLPGRTAAPRAGAMLGLAAVIITTRSSTPAGEWSSTSPATAPGPAPPAAEYATGPTTYPI